MGQKTFAVVQVDSAWRALLDPRHGSRSGPSGSRSCRRRMTCPSFGAGARGA